MRATQGVNSLAHGLLAAHESAAGRVQARYHKADANLQRMSSGVSDLLKLFR